MDLNVIVENHGGLSSNGRWLAGVIEQVGRPNCGTLPDFGNFGDYDRYQGVTELMPFAKGVSAKSNTFDADGNEVRTDYRRMLKIVTAAGYRGWVGVEPNDLTPELAESFGISRLQGVVVTGVLQNGPAFKAGVRPGDVLLGVDGKSVESVDQLLAAIAALKPGVTASLSIERGGSPLSVSVNPAQRPKQRPVDR
jgi:membrane-associated protease RseP (regulator of RpoE activity)